MSKTHQHTSQALSILIKEKAHELGFSLCGICKPEPLEEERVHLERWLDMNLHGEMKFMENHIESRTDPCVLVKNTKSIIVCALPYFPKQQQPEHVPRIAKYAYGRDYHKVLKKKLLKLFEFIQSLTKTAGRCFTDSAPIMETTWAIKAGLGWKGKNTLVINNDQGSFFLLGEIMLDIELDYDSPTAPFDGCGSCTKCMDACPTMAITAPRVLDANRCISYLTIELKGAFSKNQQRSIENHAFGCDICQDVCPYNKNPLPTEETDFQPREAFLNYTLKQWSTLTPESFFDLFNGTPVMRAKFEGLKRNLQANFINSNKAIDSLK